MTALSQPWNLDAAELDDLGRSGGSGWLVARIVSEAPQVWDHVAQAGLFPARTQGSHDLWLDAAAAIGEVAPLAAIVRARVRYVHVVAAPPSYDVSHSEPRWSDRVFVSVPERMDDVGALRLAENVIHEAMHLHLTAFEAITPLVADPVGETYSPWRNALRPFGGVLHGLFVFACLAAYFRRLPEGRYPLAVAHLRQRRRDIARELVQVDRERLARGLTPAGQALVNRLMALQVAI